MLCCILFLFCFIASHSNAEEPLYEFHSDNPFKGKLIGCEDLKDIKIGAPFAHGQKKEVVKWVNGQKKKKLNLHFKSCLLLVSS